MACTSHPRLNLGARAVGGCATTCVCKKLHRQRSQQLHVHQDAGRIRAGLRKRRGSPKHLCTQPGRSSGAQCRGIRGVCSGIVGSCKTSVAPAGHLTRRSRPGRRTRASCQTSAQARPNPKLRKRATHGAGSACGGVKAGVGTMLRRQFKPVGFPA